MSNSALRTLTDSLYYAKDLPPITILSRITLATSAMLPSYRFERHVFDMLSWTVHVNGSLWPLLQRCRRSVSMDMSSTCSAGEYTRTDHCERCRRSVSIDMSLTCSAGQYSSKDHSGHFCKAAVVAFRWTCLGHVPLDSTHQKITLATSATLPSWRFDGHVFDMFRWTVHAV